MKLLCVQLAVCCLLTVVSAVPLWVRTYGNPFNGLDEVHAIGADDSGNVVVSGFSGLSRTDNEFVTIKYKPNGDTAWVRHFNPGNGLDGATALAIDRADNVVVTGYLGGSTSEYGSWQTIKYSPAGESLWANNWQYGVECRPYAICVDTAGNSYLTGAAGSQNYFDFAVVKLDPSGNLAWQFIYDGGDNDYAVAVAVDLQGNVYATGSTVVSGSYTDLLTMKISPAGESLWKNVYAGPGGKTDQGRYIAVDASGNCIVSGISNDTANRSDYITIKYAPNGDTLWTRRYNGPGNQSDQPTGLSLDAAGNVYVTGGSYDVSNNLDYATIKYAPDGTQRWIDRYPGPTHQSDAQAIALDADANVYVTGYSLSASYLWGAATVKYDSSGNQRWAERHDPVSGENEAYVLAVGPDSSVFVGGRTNGDYMTIKYGTAGGVAEDRAAPACLSSRLVATIVRGVLRMAPAADRLAPAALLNISGRKVLDLQPGPNDVSRLAPGVYFARSTDRGQRSVAKIVIER